MSKFLKFIVNIFLIGAILAAVAILVPPILGVSTTIVESTSMSTNLKLGSITYSTTVDVSEIKAGDEVLKENGTSTYAYIVRTADPASGQFVCVSATDPDGQEETVMLRNTVSKVAVTVPYLGYLVIAMNSFEGRLIVGLVVALIVILFILSELWKEVPEDEEEIDEDEETEEEDTRNDEYPAQLTAREETGIDTDAIREAMEENRAAEEADYSVLQEDDFVPKEEETGTGFRGEESDEVINPEEQEEAPAEVLPAEETPAEEAPAEETPAEETSAEEAPAEETFAAETPSEEMPIEETSAEETLSEDVPAEETTAAEIPVEGVLVEEAPAEEILMAETSVEETPAGETPAEEVPEEGNTEEEAADEETAPKAKMTWAERRAARKARKKAEKEARKRARLEENEPPEKVSAFEIPHPEKETDTAKTPEEAAIALDEASRTSGMFRPGEVVNNDVAAAPEVIPQEEEVPEDLQRIVQEAEKEALGAEPESAADEGTREKAETAGTAGAVQAGSPLPEQTAADKTGGEAARQEFFVSDSAHEEEAVEAISGLTDVTEEPVVLDDGRFVPVDHPTLEEIRRQAKNAGISPKETRDDVTGITVVDYSGLL